MFILGAGTYQMEPDGVDIDLSMKIVTNGQGEHGAGAGEVPGTGPGTGEVPGAGVGPTPTPALCPVPCSQTKPTTPVSGATLASTATTVASGGTEGVTPSQGPGPTTGGLASTTSPTTGGGGGKRELETYVRACISLWF